MGLQRDCMSVNYSMQIKCVGAFSLQVGFKMFVRFSEGTSSPQRVNWTKLHAQGHIAAKTGI